MKNTPLMAGAAFAIAAFPALVHGADAQGAPSSVAIYGVFDSGLVLEGGGPGGNVTRVTGGASAGSRLGFRGTEALGGGNAVDFVLESGFQSDTGNQASAGVLFNRQSFIRLTGGYGSFALGRQYSLIYMAVTDIADPFTTGSAARANNILQMAGTRVSNAIDYTSPAVNGVRGELVYAPGEQAGRSDAGRSYAGALGYTKGALDTRLVLTGTGNIPAQAGVAVNTVRTLALVGAYKLVPFKLHGGYAINRDRVGMDSRDLIAGLTWVNGPHRVAGSYIRHDERGPANSDVDQYGIGWFYSLSKRTNTYAVYARQNRKNAAAAAAFFVGNSTENGTGNRGVNLGIKHVF